MKFIACSALALVASLALAGPPVECGTLSSFMPKLSKEWQWIDTFLKDDSSPDRINKYFAERQAEMEPKLRTAFQLVVDAVNANPAKTECSESESLKVTRLLDALGINVIAPRDYEATGVRDLAFRSRRDYGYFCVKIYAQQLEKLVANKLEMRVRSTVELFGADYVGARDLRREDLFRPERKLTATGFATSGLLGRAVFASVRGWMSKYEKQFNRRTGKEEYQWTKIVEGVKGACNAYQGQVKGVLEAISKDAVVSRSFALTQGYQIWRSWSAAIACDQLGKFESEKVGAKLAIAEARAEEEARLDEMWQIRSRS